ncbi:hypothetical protein J3R83DRAFT_5472 [Lanmaoa asiatica]|nr:hypothetical protein J3R83DRAFT_5472 [Lanmaoa asiatica]
MSSTLSESDNLNSNSVQVSICRLPAEIEYYIFFLASTDCKSGSQTQAGITVDLYCQPVAELFISSLESRSAPLKFARTTIKVLHLRGSVNPEQGAKILWLCQGLQALTLKIVVDLPDNQNPLRAPLNSLHLTTLSLDLASTFYGPVISLDSLPLLNRIECLHLTNPWVAMRGLYINLQELRQLTHVSFPVPPPGRLEQSIHTEVLAHVLHSFPRLRVVIMWRMLHQESQVLYDFLVERGFRDRRVVVFNAMRFAGSECAQSGSGGAIWRLAEMVVQWRKSRNYDKASRLFPVLRSFPCYCCDQLQITVMSDSEFDVSDSD